MRPAVTALVVILSGLSGLALIGAASVWAKLARYDEKVSERPTIPVHRLRAAAAVTAGALALLGVSLVCLAILSVPWGD